MLKIRFKTLDFELASTPSVLADRLQVTIVKGTASMEDLLAETDNVENVVIYEDDKISSVYKGYNKLFALTLIRSVNTPIEKQKVSIELQNTDLQDQVNQLYTTINRLQTQSVTQGAQLNTINTQVAEISSLQSSALDDLGTELSALAEAQETQNKAIEDLGSVLSDMMESEDAE